MTLALRLKQVRSFRGLTQAELAERAGMKQQTIDKIERGITKRPREITNLAKALEVSPSWLQFGFAELDNLTEDSLKVAIDWQNLPEETQAAIRTMINAALPHKK